jgi:uncharacterized protein involved in exopolysaccharide biosynthesis
MSRSPPLKVVNETGTVDLHAHHEKMAQELLGLLWRRKWTLAGFVAVVLAVATAALVRMGPSYTSEAIIRVDFAREGAPRETGGVAVDASALVDSTARLIRTRATADQVVTRRGLDTAPRFQHQALLAHLLSMARTFLLHEVAPTPHELAVNAIMRQVRVTNDPQSYLITISAASSAPEEAARLANAVASEYLRNQAQQQVAEAESTAGRQLAEAMLTYGLQHPMYLRARARFEELHARLAAIRNGISDEDIAKLVIGESMIPASVVLTPSGPNVVMTLGFAVVLALAVGIWFVRNTSSGEDRTS